MDKTPPIKAFGPRKIIGERYGDGDPRILALHGWGRTHRDFDGVLEGLNAIAIDLPGFGATPAPPEPWGAREYAEAILSITDEFGDPPVVVGHSFGGRVALCLAAAHPDAVKALVLTGVPLVRPEGKGRTSMRYRVVRGLNRIGLLSEERLERARGRYGSADYRKAGGVMREVLVKAVNETYEDEIAKVTCPVELVWGDQDTAAPVEPVRELLPEFESVFLTVIEGCGHETLAEAPDSIRAAIARAEAASS